MVIIDLFILTLIHTLSAILGRKILLKLKLFNGSYSENLFLGMGVGLFIFAYLTFMLGILGLLYREIFIFIFSLMAIIYRREIYEIIRNIYSRIKFRSIHLHQIFLLGILLFTAFCNLCYNYVPPAGDDELTAHLALPKLYSQSKEIYALPESIPSHYVQTIEMLYTIDTLIRGSMLARLHHYFLGLCLLLLVYFLTKKYISETIALLAAVLFYTMPQTTQLVGHAKPDMGTAYFGLLAIMLFLKFLYQEDKKNLYISAFMAGISFATKYNAIFLILSLVIVHMFLQLKNNVSKIQIVRTIFYFAIFSCIPILPWLFKSYLLTGNPFYPFNILPGLPYHEFVDYVSKQSSRFPFLMRIIRFPLGLIFPGKDAGGPLMQMGPIVAAFMPLIIFIKLTKTIAIFFWISILNVLLMAIATPDLFYGFSHYRLISNVIFCMLSAYVVEQLLTSILGIRKIIFAFLILGLFVPNMAECGYFGLKRLPVFLGLKSKIEYLRDSYSKYHEPYELVEFVNSTISPKDNILFICAEPAIFYYIPMLVAPQFSYLERHDIENILRDLSDRNIRYIIMNEKIYGHNPDDGSYTDPFTKRKLGWLNDINLKTYFDLIYRKSDYVVYKIKKT